MDEIIVMVLFAAAGLITFGPWIGFAIQSYRIRSLENRINGLQRSISRLESPDRQQQLSQSSLAELTATARETRSSDQQVATSENAPATADAEVLSSPWIEVDDVPQDDAVHRDALQRAPERTGRPTGEQQEKQQKSVQPPPRRHAPAQPNPASSVATSSNEGDEFRARSHEDDRAELLVVRAMTWVGVVTLVLGVGFLYRYALARGWVSDSARVFGGSAVGIAGLVAAVVFRRKDFVFFADSLAAAGSGVIKLSVYAATVWYGMVSYPTGFIGFVVGGTVLWAYAVFYCSRLAASLATVAALLTPALLPDFVGPTQTADVHIFAGYLWALNFTIAAVCWVRAWRLPAGIATVGTGVYLIIWYVNAFDTSQTTLALAWLAGFAVTFVSHALTGPLKTHVEHRLDGPILVAGASFLLVAAIGVTVNAGFLTRAAVPSALAISYLVMWVLHREKLPGQLGSLLGAVTAFLIAAVTPFWLSPAWTMVTWAALAWLWGRLAIRTGSPVEASIAKALFGVVQFLTICLTVKSVLSAHTVPLPVWDWTTTGSIPGQLKALFATVPVGEVSLLGMFLHARSLSLLACGVAALGLMVEVARVANRDRTDIDPQRLRAWFGAIAVVNLVGISLSEWIHAAMRFDWTGSTSIVIWLLHFAVVTAGALWWMSRDVESEERRSACSTLLTLSLTTAGIALIAVISEAMSRRINADIMLPFISLRSGFMVIATVVVGIAARRLPGTELTASTKRLATGGTIAMLSIWVVSETVQVGKFIGFSASEISALLTAILGLVGVVLMTVGFARAHVGFRRAGLILLSIATAKVYLVDIWTASSEIRTVAFLVLGVTLIGSALLYRSYRDQFKEWLGDGNNVLH